VRRRRQVLDEHQEHDERTPKDVDRGIAAYGRAMAYLLAGWTVLIWAGRVRNIVDADGRLVELIVPVLLLVLGALTFLRPRTVGPLLAMVTVIVWVVRVPLVLVHHHSAGFVAVHIVLAAVSLTLSALVLRRVQRPARV